MINPCICAALRSSSLGLRALIYTTAVVSILSGCSSLRPKKDAEIVELQRMYLQRLEFWINNPLPPSARFAAEVFLSQGLINDVLAGLKSVEIPINAHESPPLKARS